MANKSVSFNCVALLFCDYYARELGNLLIFVLAVFVSALCLKRVEVQLRITLMAYWSCISYICVEFFSDKT